MDKINSQLTLLLVAGILAVIGNSILYNNELPYLDIPLEVHTSFQKFQIKYSRVYSNNSEYIYRLGVFYKNVQRIKSVNKGNFKYRAAINKFADLTREEFRAKYLGVKFNSKSRNYKKFDIPKNIPKSVDMRDKGAVNAIQDQKRCGSCWAFSAIAAMEASYKLEEGQLLKFSEQQLVDCSFDFGNHGCGGGWMERAYKYSLKYGTMTNGYYPYIAQVQNCKYNPSMVEAVMTKYINIEENSPSQVEIAASISTVATAVDAQGLDIYDSGIFDGYCTTEVNHGVNIIGYGTSDEGVDFWIGRNCWGTDWGEEGYFRMVKNTEPGPGKCGFATCSSVVEMARA